MERCLIFLLAKLLEPWYISRLLKPRRNWQIHMYTYISQEKAFGEKLVISSYRAAGAINGSSS